MLWSTRRFVIGLAIVLLSRQLANILAKILVPRLARMAGVASSDHDAIGHAITAKEEEAKKSDKPVTDLPEVVGYNSNTGVRVLTYTAVGWAVSHLSPHVFELLGI
jgi:hypothetical protein